MQGCQTEVVLTCPVSYLSPFAFVFLRIWQPRWYPLRAGLPREVFEKLSRLVRVLCKT